MKAIGPDHKVTVHTQVVVTQTVGDIGAIAGEVMRLHVFCVVNHHALHAVTGVIQVAGDFGLTIDHHRVAATETVQVHPAQLALVRNVKAVVDFAFAVHALAALGLVHQFGKAMLEHPGANTAQHVVAALLFQHHVVDALEVQQLRQHQPCGAATNDAYLGFHASVLLNFGVPEEKGPNSDPAFGSEPSTIHPEPKHQE